MIRCVPVVAIALVASATATAAEPPSPISHDPSRAPLESDSESESESESSAGSEPSPAAPLGPPLRVAVYDLEVDESYPERTARVVTDSVLFEVRKLQRISAIGMDEVRAMLDLEAQKQMVGCSAEESCLADIAGALGVDGLLIGSIARVGEESVFSIKRIDQQEAKTVANVTKRLPRAGGEELLAAVGEMVAEVFPEYALREGKERGVSAEVGRRLNPPPLHPWVFWSAAGTTGALLASAGLASGAWLIFQSDYRALADRSATEVVDGVTLKDAGGRAQAAELAGWSLLGAAVVTGAVTGVLALFTDFYGYGEDAL